MTQKCRNCRHFALHNSLTFDLGTGDCRARAPQASILSGRWPTVCFEESCGEWSALPETHVHKEYRLESSDGIERCVCGASNSGYGWSVPT